METFMQASTPRMVLFKKVSLAVNGISQDSENLPAKEYPIERRSRKDIYL